MKQGVSESKPYNSKIMFSIYFFNFIHNRRGYAQNFTSLSNTEGIICEQANQIVSKKYQSISNILPNITKGIGLCHKLRFCTPYIFETQYRKPQIYEFSLKYQLFTSSGCKDIGIGRKLELMTKAQFLYEFEQRSEFWCKVSLILNA